jgi:uncharacterized iron-regulated membrane protein
VSTDGRSWIVRPQTTRVRKFLFQIHLWTGVTVCLYVAVVSISGSALVFRRDLTSTQVHRKIALENSGRPRLSAEDLQESVQRAYPGDEILAVIEPRNADQPYGVVLAHGRTRFERLFDPHSGANLGDPRSVLERALGWLADVHDNLLSGGAGRTINGMGSAMVVLLSLTGLVIWWPGIKNWRRSTRIMWRARFARVNWDVHSAVGFWCSLLVLIWGISGICLCFPGAFDFVLNSKLRFWIMRLHFGRFNAGTEVLWTLLGLAPAVLAVTGALMWWNRVLSKKVTASG